MTEIYFHSEDIDLPVSIDEPAIRNWLITLAEAESQEISSLNYIFCSDEFLLTINKDFLNHDYYTDIITFDYSEVNVVSGDIYISIDRVVDNAREYSATLNHELMRVIAHGCLHLLGYKDKTDEEQSVMTQQEESALLLLQKMSVPRGTHKKQN